MQPPPMGHVLLRNKRKMELSRCYFVLFFADPWRQAADVIAWLAATTDSFQCGPAAFLVRGCESLELSYALEARLPNKEGYFICTVDHPASFRRAPSDLPLFMKWLYKDPITTPASQGQYSFCYHCGTTVEPYSAYQEDGVKLFRLDKPLKLYLDVFGGRGCYWCRGCEFLWRAPSWADTGNHQACGHFVPLYETHCATCGIKPEGDSLS
jgi:hypothetical protein